MGKKISGVHKVIFIAVMLGITILLGGIGAKVGLWLPMAGFLMTYAFGLISFLVMFFVLNKYLIDNWRKTVLFYISAIILTGGAYFIMQQNAPVENSLPGIHDITTDIENPPEFIALLNAPGRKNSFDYPDETAEKQVVKYPMVKPLMTDLTPADAYSKAVQVAKQMNWTIVGENPALGRFEATDDTKWFNFHDDLVVRVAADVSGSLIDLRSLSRVGGSDHGLGAIRIMKFQRQFSAE